MNPYVCEVCCDVCGGPAVATPRVAAAQWFGPIQHSDPRVCAMYLADRERKLREREAALKEVETSA